MILGITVLVAPGVIQVPDEVLAGDLLLMVVAAVACIPVFVWGSRIIRAEGAVFVAAYAGYLVWLLVSHT